MKSITVALTLALALPAFAQKNAIVPDSDPEVERKSFIVAPGFEVNLFAADPMLAKPIQMNFDPQGRLWVASSETYPQIKPGAVANDKIIILEDTKGVGRADKVTVFADGLLIPTGVLPGDGGAYVANSTEILHLSASKPGGKADKRRVVLSGFGTEDTHHIIHTFRWGPDGAMYFNQSIYIHSHVETPHGVKHLNAGGIWRYEPKMQKLDVFARGWVNAWGHQFDKYGNSFVTDGAGGEGINHAVPGFSYVTAYDAPRIHHGLNPGSPKHCGLEIISGRHFPDDWQGDCITNDFRGHRVCRFKLRDDGSTFESREMMEVIKTAHGAFRPIDCAMGPDGALYIADWYNPIIQHGEVDFRDERRDHTHGRIWRVTAKGRPLVPKPKLVDATVPELLEQMKAPEQWTRSMAKRVIIERSRVEEHPEDPHLDFWLSKIAGEDHALLEALWLTQSMQYGRGDVFKKMMLTGDPKCRAALVRYLGWLGDVKPDFLSKYVDDVSPLVRLEAVRVLGKCKTKDAAVVALNALDNPMDATLEYALWLTVRELEPYWLPEFVAGKLDFGGDVKKLTFAISAAQSPEVITPLVGMLKNHKFPPAKQPELWNLVARLGGTDDLDQAFSHAMYSLTDDKVRLAILIGFEQAFKERKAKPRRGDNQLDQHTMDKLSSHVCRIVLHRLNGHWKLEQSRERLMRIASGQIFQRAPSENRPELTPQEKNAESRAAMEGLVLLGGPQSVDFLERLADGAVANQPRPGVMPVIDNDAMHSALLALIGLDAAKAAPRAADQLRQSPAAAEEILTTYLRLKNGPTVIAKEIAKVELPTDVAKICSRIVRGSGNAHVELTAAIAKAGRLGAAKKDATPEEVKALTQAAISKGDAKRGEAIYRRKELQCQSCHAIAGAGGLVGPDLSSIGASAQPDYLVESLLLPNKAIKEGYHTIDIVKADGKLVSGIKVRESPKDITLRDKDDKEITIANDDIETKKNGRTLMPDGATDTLTQQELFDLTKFLSVLGKVGAYEPRKERYVRKWEVIEPTKENLEQLRHSGASLAAQPKTLLAWTTTYSHVNGSLAMADVPRFVVWKDSGAQSAVRFKLNATAAGAVKLKLSEVEGLELYANGKPVTTAKETTLDLPVGETTVTILFQLKDTFSILTVELDDVAGSPARATIVSGKAESPTP